MSEMKDAMSREDRSERWKYNSHLFFKENNRLTSFHDLKFEMKFFQCTPWDLERISRESSLFLMKVSNCNQFVIFAFAFVKR